MSQVRLNIGVPRAGSAAKLAEDGARSSAAPQRMPLPRAGSAARDAEERKRAEATVAGTAVMAFRAGGGVPVAGFAPAGKPGSNEMERPAPVTVVDRASTQAEGNTRSSEIMVQHSHVNPEAPGMIHAASSRVQSLFRTLFSSGGSAS